MGELHLSYMNIIKLHEGDQHSQTLTDAVLEVLYERGEGVPIPSILGVLELVKLHIVNETLEE